MIQAKSNETPVATPWGHWLWCHDPEDGWEGYLHQECDMIADQEGYCLGCGLPSPAATGQASADPHEQRSNVNRIIERKH